MINSKKYFLVMLAVIGIQLGLGINLANAVPCEDKVDAEFNYNGDYGVKGKVWEYLWGNTHAKYTSVEDAKNKLYDTAVRYIDNRYEGNRQECVKEIKYETNGGIELIACMNQVLANNGCDPSVFKRDGASPRSNSSNSKSNQSSSSGSSSQSSKKANQQANNSQSNQSNNSNNSSTSSQIQSNSQSNAGQTSTETYSDLDMSPEQAVLVREAAQTYTAKNAAFEESHKGLRRTHKKEDVATKCLIMEGKHLKNTCDFRVEYTFCAYKPDREAFKAAFEMAAAFDCEQRKFGSSGLPAKLRDAGSFTAEALYVFGCKDPSLPRGVTYERGRGIFGRCAE